MNKLDKLLNMAYDIGMSGEHDERVQVACSAATPNVKIIDNFRYAAIPETPEVEVVNLENGDPFISRWRDGQPCRKHSERYDAEALIPQHYKELAKKAMTDHKTSRQKSNKN